MEKHLGYRIPRGYEVHHINGKKTDNRLKNLLLVTKGEHKKIHRKLGWGKRRG